MELITLITGPLEVNTYILYGKSPNECVIIDPSDTKMVTAKLDELSLKPTHILLTHSHFDHILSVADLQEKYGAKVCIHTAEATSLLYPMTGLSMGPRLSIRPARADMVLGGGETLSCAGFSINAIATPGHSPGSMCYATEDGGRRVIFAGDTLFRLSVGRSDLPGGDANALYASIKEKLFALEGDYEVYPGHMRKTTLQFEREHNPFMLRWSPETW